MTSVSHNILHIVTDITLYPHAWGAFTNRGAQADVGQDIYISRPRRFLTLASFSHCALLLTGHCSGQRSTQVQAALHVAAMRTSPLHDSR